MYQPDVIGGPSVRVRRIVAHHVAAGWNHEVGGRRGHDVDALAGGRYPAWARRQLGMILRDQGRYETAEEQLLQALDKYWNPPRRAAGAPAANAPRPGAPSTDPYMNAVFEAAVQFARAQGPVAAPETAHAIRATIDEALAAREAGEERVILFNYSGHGLLDLAAYDDFLHGRLVDV